MFKIRIDSFAFAFAFCLSFGISTKSFSQGTSQYCRIGATEWVSGCTATCTASWEGSNCPQSCTATPPAGTALLDHRYHGDPSINNGGHTISRFSNNQSFDFKRRVEQAYDEAINLAAKNGDKDYAASLRLQRKSAINEAEEFSSSHQLLRVTVDASKHGSWLNRKRGWAGVSVDILVRCIAPANLTEQLTEQAPPRRRTRSRN